MTRSSSSKSSQSVKFNKSSFANAVIPEKKSYLIIRDRGEGKSIQGLYLKIGSSSKTFFLEKKISGRKGNAITVKIGSLSVLSVDEARRQAKQIAATCERGDDPREILKKGVPVVTLEMAYTKFQELKKLRDSTMAVYQSQYDTHLKRWSKRDITLITADDMYEVFMKAESRATAREAMLLFNNIFDTVAPIFKYERKRIMTNNPFRAFKASVGQEWKREQKRKKAIITVDDLGKAVATLESLTEDPNTPTGERRHYQAFQVSLFTGLRFGESAGLEWSRIDFRKKTISIDREQAKNHNEHTVYMNEYVFNLLERIWTTRTVMSPCVFPAARSLEKHITKRTEIFRKLEGIWGFRNTSHANRRTFASSGGKIGLPYLLIKRLLNHLY